MSFALRWRWRWPKHLFGKSIYIGSAGVKPGEPDPFAIAAMEEIGLDISKHKPHTFEELDEWEGLNFDLIVTLSPEAHHKALELTRTLAAEVEYWPTADPSDTARQPRAEARRLPRPARHADEAHPGRGLAGPSPRTGNE